MDAMSNGPHPTQGPQAVVEVKSVSAGLPEDSPETIVSYLCLHYLGVIGYHLVNDLASLPACRHSARFPSERVQSFDSI
jgi:hypothetical protein